MRSRTFWIALAVAVTLVGPTWGQSQAEDPAGLNWKSFGRDHTEQHYSPLDQVNGKTVSRLGLAWSADLGHTNNSFTAPLEVDGVLYVETGLSVIHAIDARSGKELWTYDPKVYDAPGDRMRAGWPVRGIAYDKGKVFTGTLDGRLIAIDAKSGKQLWSVQTIAGDLQQLYISGPPWVFNGMVAIGNGGADYSPVRGYVTTYDQNTGKKLWRFYTVPGDPAKGFESKAMEMASKTWTGDWWKFGGGGTPWHAMAYDRDLNLLYVGTGNGSPWNRHIRSPGGGDNLFLASIVALNADTGEYVWHYQENPGESWDYNSTMDIELADLKIDGKVTPVLMHVPKNGFFYVLNRRTGKLISAGKFAKKITWADHIDLTTGKPMEKPESRYPDGKVFELWPSPQGAHSITAMAFSPKTGLAYVPAEENGRYYNDPPDIATWSYKPSIFFFSTGVGPTPPGLPVIGPRSSRLEAYDPITQKSVWEVPLPNFDNGGVLATGGNLVFQGDSKGWLSAYDAATGRKMWSFDVQDGVRSNPISYSLDGKQYITLVTGFRTVFPNTPDWDYYAQKRRVLTFVLDGKAMLPPPSTGERPVLDDPAFTIDPAKVVRGGTIYSFGCSSCHGGNVISAGGAPDLRRSRIALSLKSMDGVLRGGALKRGGMPTFQELSSADIEAIQHYVRQQARDTLRLGKEAAEKAARPIE